MVDNNSEGEDNGVGRVLGTEHTSTREFRVVLDETEYLQLDDLVVVRTQVPKQGEVRTYGIVTEVAAMYEGATFESDTHRIAVEGTLPGAKVRSAEVAITRVDPELWVSPDPGEKVERARGEERNKALYVDEMGRPLPIGLGRDGEPVFVDLDFFDGRKGGHMSISGISGVATKTSFALFFLRLLAARPDVLGEGAANLRILVFNVKGEDLLWLDKKNRYFDPAAADVWALLGVEPGPFPSVSFWAPPRVQSGDVVIPDTGGRQEGVDAFSWTPRQFIEGGLLRFLFTDAVRQPQPDPVHRGDGSALSCSGLRLMSRAVPVPSCCATRSRGMPPVPPSFPIRGSGSSSICAPWLLRSRSSSTPRTANPTRSGLVGSRQAPSRPSCAGSTPRHTGSAISCAPERATTSIGGPPR